MITFYQYCKSWIHNYHIFLKNSPPPKNSLLFFHLGLTECKCLTWPPKKHYKQFWWKSFRFGGHFVIKMIEQQLYSINRCQRQTSTAQMDGIVPGHHKFLAKLRKGWGGRSVKGGKWHGQFSISKALRGVFGKNMVYTYFLKVNWFHYNSHYDSEDTHLSFKHYVRKPRLKNFFLWKRCVQKNMKIGGLAPLQCPGPRATLIRPRA